MTLFGRNPNEAAYVGGRKHFTDVIKNTGPGNLLIWLNGEEDFNTNSTLIVAESEEALFFRDGIVEEVFDGGKYVLSTENYPFISRLRNLFSGGVSTFNCKVYFVRKAHSMEILWGTDSPIQVRDPVLRIATSVTARGAFKVQVDNSKLFLIKLLGNNVQQLTQEELTRYFRREFMQHIKSNIAKAIRESNEEILGICERQALLAETLTPILREPLANYGVRLVNFTIEAIDIPEQDPNRQKLEAAYANKGVMGILGNDWGRQQAKDILHDVANNPGAGGVAATGAGLGMGMVAGGVFNSMAQQMFAPMQEPRPEERPFPQAPSGGCFVQRDGPGGAKRCTHCGTDNPEDSLFCGRCGTRLDAPEATCGNCGAVLPPESRFCNKCGTPRN